MRFRCSSGGLGGREQTDRLSIWFFAETTCNREPSLPLRGGAERVWDVFAIWGEVWAGRKYARDLADPQRRLRWAIDGLPERVREALPLVAEATAKELPPLNLTDALELKMLIARKDPRRHPRVAARWLLRYLEDVTTRRSTKLRWSPHVSLPLQETGTRTRRCLFARWPREPLVGGGLAAFGGKLLD
jgi:hypothetical protein